MRMRLVSGPEVKLAAMARRLADDFAIKSKAQATWKAYRSWFTVFEAFCCMFAVDLKKGKQVFDSITEVMRVSVALLTCCYSMGTIDIYVSAVQCFCKMAKWGSLWESEAFRATMAGVKREMGVAKHKQPPIEASHVAAMLQMTRPGSFTK